MTIVFKTKFNGEPQYFGAFFYNSASQTIDFYYDSKDGEFTSGTVELLDNGFKQAFQQASPMNTTKFQMTVLRTGADAYSFEVHKKGSKDVLVSVKYQRQ